MKLLLDACVWGGAGPVLQAAGHDVVWAGDWTEDPGDAQLLAWAEGAGRALVTLDKDFGELAVVFGASHRGIIRLVNIGARRQADACLHILAKYQSELADGAIITVEPGRVRIRPGGIERPNDL